METTRQGSGPPLVLVHGLGARRESWRPMLADLTPAREVVTVDLPGHGTTAPLEGVLTFDRLVDGLQQHLVAEGLGAADPAGGRGAGRAGGGDQARRDRRRGVLRLDEADGGGPRGRGGLPGPAGSTLRADQGRRGGPRRARVRPTEDAELRPYGRARGGVALRVPAPARRGDRHRNDRRVQDRRAHGHHRRRNHGSVERGYRGRGASGTRRPGILTGAGARSHALRQEGAAGQGGILADRADRNGQRWPGRSLGLGCGG
ncbi:MAG: alpha/beta fold hydrolase [Gemmatimonadetes bacterium]|nr:alpha/beta fold hydrolase [Gemmatimonadota bacterium]